ncbi:MAG TPA: endonuclease/exonuclease/phosphatase family protein [Planococcus sp. (in: firmicutes)]|nr:endonuclease/exonuclease/phosphatase family protein [Planococcus sp. (in: firmicutes)]
MEGSIALPRTSIKIMSFNIAHGSGMDGVLDLEKTAQVIEASGAEIVGLQELDRFFSERSAYIDQVEFLSKRLGMYAAFGASIDQEADESERPRKQYGNAVFSKYPIKYQETHMLTQVIDPFGNNEQRSVLETIIDVNGTYISVYNTHLALKDEELKVSLDELLSIAGKNQFPTIITGDFNAPPTHIYMLKMEQDYNDVFYHQGRNDDYTYPAPYENEETGEKLKPVTRIDYIFTDAHFNIETAERITTSVSDHLPITAELVLTNSKSTPLKKRPSQKVGS